MTQTYGNTKMPESTRDRPLVTFALFAFNQEEYIRAAVEGALSQTYSPLEIILSDDCSTDGTFEIMQQMAKEYHGVNQVKVRRNSINLLTALHVQTVGNEASGDLIVVAAGDDISLPNRVERLVEAWLQDERRAVVLHSPCRIMKESGEVLDQIAYPRSKPGVPVDMDWCIREKLNPLISPSAAYEKSLFTVFPPMIGGSLIEDGPLVLRGFLLGHFLAIDEPLVLLREVQESSGRGYSCHNLSRWNRFVRSKVISNFTKLQDIPFGRANEKQSRTLANRTRKDIRNLTRCIFDEEFSISLWGRMRMALAIFLYYPSTYRLRGRVGFALEFADFGNMKDLVKRALTRRRLTKS